jgi:hypothetical protein
MNDLQKSLSKCLLATAALLVGASPAWAQTAPSLGAAADFAVLGGTNVTCTSPGSVTGDIGVAPGSAVPYTNTGCVITGAEPAATDAAAILARTDFLDAYTTLKATACTDTLPSTITGPVTLAPGVYCSDAATALTGTGVLILDAGGDANAVWIFNIGAALTGTNFSVVMANGGQPCNVYWVPSAAVTMSTSALSGNILAGDAIGGSVTMTGGTVAGRVLANVAVTLTGTNVIGCAAGPGSPPSSCKPEKNHGHDKDKHHKKDKHDKKCNQGVGNGPEGCDPGKSDHGSQFPFGSNDEDGGTKGDPGHKGGKK